MKIYVIAAGEYSDYHIVAATTDKETADRIAKAHRDNWEDPHVEEYDDIGVVEDYRATYHVSYSDNSHYFCYAVDPDVEIKKLNEVSLYKRDYVPGYSYDIYVKAKDQDHALKIAQDKIAEFKAKQNNLI